MKSVTAVMFMLAVLQRPLRQVEEVEEEVEEEVDEEEEGR